ncbi:hypothetical protein niasHT_032512 [Heterodera trifolii]|uniref:Uncharacterized protein n=1 Tax=Heterodera trifolii TaxID=157864 RepID=A0ABD2IH63_9BILA
MLLPPPIHGQISSILLLLIRKRPTAETTFFGHMTFGHKIAAHRPIPRGGRGVGLSICDPSLSPHPCVTRHHRHIFAQTGILSQCRCPQFISFHNYVILAPHYSTKFGASEWHFIPNTADGQTQPEKIQFPGDELAQPTKHLWHLRIPAPVGHVFLFLAPKLLAGGWHLANRYIRPHPSPSIPMCANANQKRHPNSNMTALKFE